MSIRLNGRWRDFEEFHREHLVFFRHWAVGCVVVAEHFSRLSHDILSAEKWLLLDGLSTNQSSDADDNLEEMREDRFNGLVVARIRADLCSLEQWLGSEE